MCLSRQNHQITNKLNAKKKKQLISSQMNSAFFKTNIVPLAVL